MDEDTNGGAQTEFTCARCGFKYHKTSDYEPFLCYRCLRFIGKKVYTIMQQVIPPVSRSEKSEV